LREWLAAQAAAGYVTFDKETGRYSLDDVQRQAFAAEGSPGFMPGFFQLLSSMFRDEPKIAEAFRSGRGVGWHEHDVALFHGTERFFRPNYAAHLVADWIPALDGVRAKLDQGANVADIGCGHGSSTLILAKAFPRSRFFGFDYHGPSIERARALAKAEGLAGRVTFETAAAKAYPGRNYDLVTFFDCLHDMGDPAGAAAHVRQSLEKDGTWMVVEPFANDRTEDNLNPVGRIFYAASTMICTPASLAQEVGLGLGAQAGQKRLTEVIKAGGFTRVRRAAETPFNLVLEARP
jgi:SAM-dependent methyltransferase